MNHDRPLAVSSLRMRMGAHPAPNPMVGRPTVWTRRSTLYRPTNVQDGALEIHFGCTTDDDGRRSIVVLDQ